eukprot:532977-Pelagomonas_calceolata.AAC.1
MSGAPCVMNGDWRVCLRLTWGHGSIEVLKFAAWCAHACLLERRLLSIGDTCQRGISMAVGQAERACLLAHALQCFAPLACTALKCLFSGSALCEVWRIPYGMSTLRKLMHTIQAILSQTYGMAALIV